MRSSSPTPIGVTVLPWTMMYRERPDGEGGSMSHNWGTGRKEEGNGTKLSFCRPWGFDTRYKKRRTRSKGRS